MNRPLLAVLLAGLMAFPCLGGVPGDDFVPFVIPAKPNPDSLVASAPQAPIGVDAPRMVARDGHFFVGDRRVRLLGVNFTFAADFPTHEAADDVALRLSQGGINCVRFHHMDTSEWKYKSGIWDEADPNKLSPEALDRLDYLIAQLAKRGIYANINLHVGRTHSKHIGLPSVPELGYDKIIDIFTPQLIAAQRDYATQLLGHVNKYRNLRYADDPEVAIVEINNEDSLFMWGSRSSLRNLPLPYSQILKTLFNTWLKARYGNTQALKAAWDKGAMPLGEELLIDREFATIGGNGARSAWPLEIHPGNEATLTKPADNAGVRIQIAKADSTSWHLQFQQPVSVVGGTYYTLEFSARADQNRKIDLGVSMAHEPWNNLGLSATERLLPQWQTFRIGFTAASTDPKARLSFVVGGTTIPVEFKAISLRVGGRDGLSPEESIDGANVRLWAESTTPARESDEYRFLAETEKAYFDSMRQFIKKDLGSQAMVTGTIVFGPLGLYGQSDMDFIDDHAYWNHPNFPGRAWDMSNWTVEQTAMVDNPDRATLFQLATSRLAGKPFTVTEYCHPAPNDFQAECVPEMATFAAAQDWDAIFFFDYGGVPTADHITSFFDFGDNPSKSGFMPAAAAIFRDAGLAPLAKERTAHLGEGDPLGSLVDLYRRFGTNLLSADEGVQNIKWPDILNSRLYSSISTLNTPAQSDSVGASNAASKITWNRKSHGGPSMYLAQSPRTFVLIGRPGTDPSKADADAMFLTFTATSLDGRPFEESRKVLLTACGRGENIDMAFSADRRTVGTKWGTSPVRIQAPRELPALPRELAQGKGTWRLTPLLPDGRPNGDAVEVSIAPDGTLKLGNLPRSMWYLLSR